MASSEQFDRAKLIGENFVAQYYSMFDTNRAGIAPLYHDSATLIIEGQRFLGKEAVIGKFVGLQYQKMAHTVTTYDVIPTFDGGLVCMVIGQLQGDSDPIQPFTQVFYLKELNGSMFIVADVFRLNIHNFA